MRFNFWFGRFLTVFAWVFVILVASELLKHHGWNTALRFAALWAAISTSIFIAVRIYYTRQGKNCPMCNDLPRATAPR
jgi:ATP/ADP translocase